MKVYATTVNGEQVMYTRPQLIKAVDQNQEVHVQIGHVSFDSKLDDVMVMEHLFYQEDCEILENFSSYDE